MAAKDVRAVRMSDETYKDFQQCAKNFANQDEAMKAFQAAYQREQLGNTQYGQQMKLDVEGFNSHLNALQALFNASMQKGVDAENHARALVATQISTLSKALDETKDKLAAAEKALKETMTLEESKKLQNSVTILTEKLHEQLQIENAELKLKLAAAEKEADTYKTIFNGYIKDQQSKTK